MPTKPKPLSVVFLIENVSLIKDRRVRQEATALQAAGCKVQVICPRGKDGGKVPLSVNGMDVYSYYQPWQGSTPVSYILEYGWALMCSFWLLLFIWARRGLDVLHAANPPDLFFLLAIPFKVLGKRFVYDQHDLSPELFELKFARKDFLYRLLLICERLSYRVADLVIVTNESFRAVALQRGSIESEKIFIVRNGPDLNRFRPGPPSNELKRGAKYLALYIGVMAEQDGVDRIIRAAAHIVHVLGRKDIRFALLGNGDRIAALQDLVRSLDLGRQVEFPGYLQDTELLAYLWTADVCLAPDPPVRLNQLSTTIKVMEYMSCGKPTVAFDLLETRRSAGDSAVYVSDDDSVAFGRAVVALLDQPKRRETMGQIAVATVRSSLHWGRSREALFAAYNYLSGNHQLEHPALIPAEHAQQQGAFD